MNQNTSNVKGAPAVEVRHIVKPLWDILGTPANIHPKCPKCGDNYEIGSHFDAAWCCFCGWNGSLTELHGLYL